MAISLSYLRDFMIGGLRDVMGNYSYSTGDINPLLTANDINNGYTSNLPLPYHNHTVYPGLGGIGLLSPPPQDITPLVREIEYLRKLLMDITSRSMPPLMITSSERDLPMLVTDDAIKAIAARKLETPVERPGSDVNSEAVGAGVALKSTAHPGGTKALGWEDHGGAPVDMWPEEFTRIADETEAKIEADLAKMKKNGDEMAKAISCLGHAADGMPPRFIPQLD